MPPFTSNHRGPPNPPKRPTSKGLRKTGAWFEPFHQSETEPGAVDLFQDLPNRTGPKLQNGGGAFVSLLLEGGVENQSPKVRCQVVWIGLNLDFSPWFLWGVGGSIPGM